MVVVVLVVMVVSSVHLIGGEGRVNRVWKGIYVCCLNIYYYFCSSTLTLHQLNWWQWQKYRIESNREGLADRRKKYKHSNTMEWRGMASYGLLPVVFIAIFALRFRNNSLIKYKATCSHKRAHNAHCTGDTHTHIYAMCMSINCTYLTFWI